MAALALTMALAGMPPALADAKQTQDFFVGNGTAGPYALSWKHILAGSDNVTVSDVALTWGVDYTLDPDVGTITFTHPLPPLSGAAVRYGYDTGQAQPQGAGLTLPLAMALNENVSLSGAYSHAATDGQKPGALNMGLNGGWQGANGGKLATHLLFVPAMTGTDDATAPNGLARLGFATSGQTRIGKPLDVAFGFSRAGLGVGSQGSDNWQAGVQKMNLNAAFAPARQLQATFGYQQADPANGHGTAQSQINAALALTPSDKVQLKTSLAQTEGGGSGPGQTLAASAVVKPAGQTELDASFGQKDAPGPGGDTENLDLKAALTGKKMSLTAETGQSSISGIGTTQSLNATVAAKPSDRAELDASFGQKDAPGTGSDTTNFDVKTTLNAGKPLTLTADVGQNSLGSGGTTQTLAAGAVVKPLDRTELDAAFSQKDAPGTANDAQALDVKAALGTGKIVSLTASLDQSSQGTQDSSAQAVRLSLNPRPTLQVNTGLSRHQSPTASAQAATVDGKMQPWAFLLLSGGYQWRTVTPVQAGGPVAGNYDSSNAQFTLAPKSALHLIGSYAQNPDDAGGNPQRLAKHGLGLAATLGALSLTGGYDWSRQYDTPTTGASVHVGLGLRFSASTQLIGDYKQDLTGVGDSPTGTSAYTLGLTRNLGDAFNLSLNAAMQQAVGPSNATPANVTATANLGMKF